MTGISSNVPRLNIAGMGTATQVTQTETKSTEGATKSKYAKANSMDAPKKNSTITREQSSNQLTKNQINTNSNLSTMSAALGGTEGVEQGRTTGNVQSHMKTLDTLFRNTPKQEKQVIHERLVEYAELCEIHPDEMFKKIESGHKIATLIADDGKSGKEGIKEMHTVDDAINLDWFLRAHIAKQDQLYLKGTAKMPDPNGNFAKFVLHCTGQIDGKPIAPYGRGSTHYPEQKDNVRSECIKAGNEYLAYDKDVAKSKEGAKVHDLSHWSKPMCIGLDAIGEKGKSLGVAGEESGTFLFMPMYENFYNDKAQLSRVPVQVMAWKTEGNPASYPDQGGSAVKLFKHGAEAAIKKGPWASKTARVGAGGMRDLKEDKLNAKVLEQINDLKSSLKSDSRVDSSSLKVKTEGLPFNVAQNLEASFTALEATTGKGSQFGLQTLKEHLRNMSHVGLDGEINAKIRTLMNTIEETNALYVDRNPGEFKLVARSEEVVLPSFTEMLADKTKFCAEPDV